MKINKIFLLFVFLFILKANGFALWGGGNISTASQTIACPGPVNFYDDGGTGSNYANSQDYTLTVTAGTAGQCLTVSFSAFNVESCCDYLKIYDGVGTGTLLANYAGSTVPASITSNSGSLTFVFHSDGSVNYLGWVATIGCVTCPPPPPPSTTMNNTAVSLTCPTSLVFYDSGGSGAPYSASESYTKTFTASGTSCVSYTFSAFDVESCCDKLYVYDGPSSASPLIGTYAGTTLPPNFTASGSSLTFVFTSDGSIQNAGWTATVSCANACSGAPSAGIGVASPAVSCSAFTTTLSLSGATMGCGINYLWYQANAIGGPYSAIGSTTTTATQTFAITGTKYFKCVLSCGVSTSTTAPITASINANYAGTGSYPISIPYSTTGQTTCGFINDITASNVANICGSSSYYTGEDVVYAFTPTVTSVFDATVTSTGSYMGMTLYNGCPTGTGVCVANAQGSAGTESFSGASGCTSAITVTAGVTYYLVLDSYAAPTCNPYDLNISATAAVASTVVPCNMAYTVSSPVFNFEAISGTVLPTTDDVLFSSVVLFGFPVCFDGLSFNGGYVASNAAFVFDAVPCFPNIQTSTYAAGGVSTGYSITAPAPTNSTSIPRNAILAPWHDINPALGGVIQYTVLGAAPNRRFILSFENIPMFSCGTSSPTIYHSSQVKIYETSNNIEIHVKQKKVCPGWNGGGAVLGLLNYNGTIYTPPVNATAHNVNTALTYTWTMTNTAYRFSTTCGASSTCGVTLPIGMKSFYGERVDKINNLYWETATEENLKKYKIQRSTDAINFIDIGQVTPNNFPSKYSFEDKNATVGIINYYRIAIYENDGTISYTSIVALGSGNNEILNASQIYPNPVNSSFSIALDSKQKGFATINVYDVFGRLVKSSANDVHGGVTQYEISVEDLKYGVYYVEVLNSFNEVISKQKFIKN
jgi:hypothetical protein